MSTGMISVVKSGHSMPEDYQKKVLEECPDSFTVTKVQDGKLIVLRIESGEYQLADSLTQTLAKDKDFDLVIYHSKEPQLSGEQQPFVLLEDAKGAILLAMCDGSCEKYDTDNASLGPEAEMITEWFAEQVSVLYQQCNKDLKKTIDLLDTASFTKKLEEHLAPRGTICLFSNTGVIRFLSFKNAAYGEYGWGNTTNTLGYSEKPPGGPPSGGGKPQINLAELEAMPYKPRKAKLLELGFKSLEEAAAALASTPAVVAADDDKTTAVSGDGEMTRPNIPTDKGDVSFPVGREPEIIPPRNCKGRALLKWFDKHLDAKGEKNPEKAIRTQLGTSYENAPAIPMSKLNGSSHFLRVINGTDKPDAAQSVRKDTGTHHIPGSPGVVEGVLAMHPDEVRRAVAARVKAKEEGPITEEQIIAPTKPFVSFTERLGDGLTIEEVLVWPTYTAIAADKNSANSLLEEMRRYILKLNPKIMKELSAAASKVAAGTQVDVSTLPFKERQALKANGARAAG